MGLYENRLPRIRRGIGIAEEAEAESVHECAVLQHETAERRPFGGTRLRCSDGRIHLCRSCPRDRVETNHAVTGLRIANPKEGDSHIPREG